MVNEVVFSAGMPETPWGGLKDSGFGRKHSEIGLLEFANVKHINQPRLGLFTFKSWWWYPYTDTQRDFFRAWLELYRSGWIEKITRLPHFLWTLIRFLKNRRGL